MTNENHNFYYKKSRLNQLRGFCNVVQSGCSVIKASAKLNIEPASVSKQITSLERDLGTKLFDRTNPKQLSLTADGKLFYELSIKELQGLDSIFETFNNTKKEINENTLNLGLYYTSATYIFPEIIGKMLKLPEFKDLKINIMNIGRDEAVEKLINKEIDLAFYPIHTKDMNKIEIEYKKTIKYDHTLVFSKDHPLAKLKNITKEDIEKYDFLIRDVNHSFSISDYLNLKRSNFNFKNAGIDISIELVKNTNTITALPEIMFKKNYQNRFDNLLGINIGNFLPSTFFYIMTLKNSMLKKSVKYIINELEKLK